MVDHVQNSLNGGEISPLVRGQIDLNHYATGAKKLLNTVCLPHGPGQNRSGTQFIAEAKNAYSQTRLIPFIASISDAYVLEMGLNYFRVFKDGAQLQTQELVRNGKMEDDDYWDDWNSPTTNERSEDQAHSGKYSRKIVASGANEGIYQVNYMNIPSGATLTGIVYVYPSVTSVTVRCSTSSDTIVNTTYTVVANQWNRIDFSGTTTDRSYNFTINLRAAGAGTFYFDDVSVTKDDICEMETNFEKGGLSQIDFAQSIDEIFIANENNFPSQIVRYPDEGWFFNEIDFLLSVRNSDFQWTVSGGGTAEYYLNVSGGGDPVIGEPYWMFKDGAELIKGTIGSLAAGEWGYGDGDSLGYSTLYYRDSGGGDPDALAADLLKIGRYPAEWYADNGYPISVTFHNDRLDWTKGEQLFFSKSSYYYDHTYGATVADDDGLNLRIGDGQFNLIMFIRQLAGGLVVMTPSNEWILSGADGTSVITANSKRAKIGSSSGSERVRPIHLNNSLIHALRHGKALKELIYDYNSDSFVGYELSDLAQHLTKTYAITELAYQKSPFKTIWAVREDGILLGVTYYPQQKVFGWHQHEIGGNGVVESIAVVPGTDYDDLYLSVKRTDTDDVGVGMVGALTYDPLGEGDANAIWSDGTYVYVASGNYGLFVYSFDGEKFTYLSSIDDGGTAYDVWGDGTHIYVANGSDGIRAYTFDGATLTNVGNRDDGDTAQGVWGDGTYIYLANGFHSLRAYTFDGSTFTATGSYAVSGNYVDVWGDGAYIYAASGGSGLYAFSYDGAAFTLEDSIDDGGSATSVWGDSTYIYLANNTDGIRAYTFDGADLTNVGHQDDGGNAFGVWANDTYVFLANYLDGLRVYTFNGSAFTAVDNTDFIFAINVFGDSNYIYTANDLFGVRAFEVQDKVVKTIERLNPFFIKPETDVDYFMDDDTTDAIFMDSAVTLDNRQDIEGMTAANPCVVTITGHGLSNGDSVRIRNVKGMTSSGASGVNGLDFTVANKTADTFELSGLDSSGFDSYESGGTAAKKQTAISGLDHLEGQTVIALGDGKKNGTTYTVSSGAITLSAAASVVHVGMSYNSDIETLPPIIPINSGSLMAEAKRISNVAMKVYETDGISVGPDEDNLIDVNFVTDTVPTGCADRLFDGLIDEVAVTGSHKKEPTILIRQANPLPMTISAIIKQVEV